MMTLNKKSLHSISMPLYLLQLCILLAMLVVMNGGGVDGMKGGGKAIATKSDSGGVSVTASSSTTSVGTSSKCASMAAIATEASSKSPTRDASPTRREQQFHGKKGVLGLHRRLFSAKPKTKTFSPIHGHEYIHIKGDNTSIAQNPVEGTSDTFNKHDVNSREDIISLTSKPLKELMEKEAAWIKAEAEMTEEEKTLRDAELIEKFKEEERKAAEKANEEKQQQQIAEVVDDNRAFLKAEGSATGHYSAGGPSKGLVEFVRNKGRERKTGMTAIEEEEEKEEDEDEI